MKKGLIILLVLLVLSTVVFARVNNIELNSPSTGTIYRDTVTFDFDTINSSHTSCSLYTNESSANGNIDFTTTVLTNSSMSVQGVQSSGTLAKMYNHNQSVQWTIGCTDGLTTVFGENRTFTIFNNSNPVFTNAFSLAISSTFDNLTEGGSSVIFGTNANASDLDGHSVSYHVVDENTSAVDCTIDSSTGQITLAPVGVFSGTTTCTFQARDNFAPGAGADGFTPSNGATNATLNIQVQSVNDEPVLSIPSQSVVQGNSSSVNITSYISDVDSDASNLIASITDENSSEVDCSLSGSLSGNNLFLNMDAASGFSGTATCEVNINDVQGPQVHNIKQNVSISVDAASPALSITVTDAGRLVRNATLSDNAVFTVKNTGNVKIENIAFSVGGLTNGVLVGTSNLTVGSASPSSTASLNAGDSVSVSVPISMSQAMAALSTGTITYSGVFNVSSTDVNITQSWSPTLNDFTNDLSMSPSEIDFGSVSRNTTSDVQNFTITNAGDQAFTNVRINYTGGKGLMFATSSAGPFNESITIASSLAAQGTSQTIFVKANIPSDQSSGTATIDTFTVETDQGYSEAFTAKATTQGVLAIKEIKVKIQNPLESSDTDDGLEDGDTVSHDARPLAKVTLSVELENTADSGSDVQLDDFVVTFEGFEFDEEDIEATKSGEEGPGDETGFIDLEFQIPIDAGEEKHEVEIIAKADNQESGDEEEVRATIFIEVDRPNHYVLIVDQEFAPSQVDACLAPTTDLILDVANLGEEDQDDILVKIVNRALGVDASKTFGLESSDGNEDDGQRTIRETISIDEDTDLGRYTFDVELFRNGRSSPDVRTSIDLEVINCRAGSPSGSSSGSVNLGSSSGTATGSQGTSSAPTEYSTSSGEFFSSTPFFVLLILGNLILLGGVVWLGVKLLL